MARQKLFQGDFVKPGHSFVLILVLFVFSSVVLAQTNYATLRGVVMDPQHLGISHATVKLTSVKTGEVRDVAANGQGIYEAAGLLPGAYLLEAKSQGFAVARRSLQLEVGQQATLDVALTMTDKPTHWDTGSAPPSMSDR
jgi:hypothetical protein